MSNSGSFTISSKYPPASRQDIAECEGVLGVTFPEDYKEFLLTYNGGTPSPQSLVIPDVGYEVMIHVLYGVRESRRSGDLVFWYELHRPYLLPGLVPIGNDPGGNPFLLGTSNEQYGKLYFWDRTGFFPETSSTENTYRVADSFAEMLNLLYNPEASSQDNE